MRRNRKFPPRRFVVFTTVLLPLSEIGHLAVCPTARVGEIDDRRHCHLCLRVLNCGRTTGWTIAEAAAIKSGQYYYENIHPWHPYHLYPFLPPLSPSFPPLFPFLLKQNYPGTARAELEVEKEKERVFELEEEKRRHKEERRLLGLSAGTNVLLGAFSLPWWDQGLLGDLLLTGKRKIDSEIFC